MKIKERYKIGEISKMFGVGLDSLRYYERLGIVKPQRDPENDYRMYGLDEIKKLNLLLELKRLGFSMKEIKTYMDNRTIASTKALLTAELTAIDERIARLEQVKSNIQKRLLHIQTAEPKADDGGIQVRHLPARYGVITDSDGCTIQELNYVTRQIFSATDCDLYTIGNCDCYFLSTTGDNYSNDYLRNKDLFFLIDDPGDHTDLLLPAGDYLTLTYRGELAQTKKYVMRMLAYAREHRYRVVSDPVEMCWIDTFETEDYAEYVTELQIRVEKEETSADL